MKFSTITKNSKDNSNLTRNLRLRISLSSHQGGRKYMEDDFSIVHYQYTPPTINDEDLILKRSFAFLGIFDGHGGDMAARFTRQNLCRNIVSQRNFWSDDDDKVCLAIHKGFVRTQKDMMKEVGNWPKTSHGLPSTSGTTASVLFIMNGKYFTGHVGDSRIVLGRKVKYSDRWAACPMTRDHKPESPRERKRIEAAGGQVMNKSGIGRVVWNRPKRNFLNDSNNDSISYDLIPFLSVARSLGDLWSLNRSLNKFIVSPEPDVKSIPINSSDKCLILASDGLWNMINLKHAIKVIQDFEEDLYADSNELFSGIIIEPSHSHSLKLLDVCLDRWLTTKFRADNTTVLVVMLDQIQQQVQNGNDSEKMNHYEFDLNESNESLDMIGDTIHTYDFDKQQTEENFLEIVKTNDEEEIESLLNNLLDQFCSMLHNDKLNQTTTLITQENELIDEDQLSLINFSTYSKLCSPKTSVFCRNNFNCSFNIDNHEHIYEQNNNTNSFNYSLSSSSSSPTSSLNVTNENSTISHSLNMSTSFYSLLESNFSKYDHPCSEDSLCNDNNNDFEMTESVLLQYSNYYNQNFDCPNSYLSNNQCDQNCILEENEKDERNDGQRQINIQKKRKFDMTNSLILPSHDCFKRQCLENNGNENIVDDVEEHDECFQESFFNNNYDNETYNHELLMTSIHSNSGNECLKEYISQNSNSNYGSPYKYHINELTTNHHNQPKVLATKE